MPNSFDNPPVYDKLVDDKGNLSSLWRNWHATFAENIQNFLTINGVIVPSLTTAQINAIQAPVNGTLVYNTTIPTPQMFINGAWHNINYT